MTDPKSRALWFEFGGTLSVDERVPIDADGEPHLGLANFSLETNGLVRVENAFGRDEPLLDPKSRGDPLRRLSLAILREHEGQTK